MSATITVPDSDASSLTHRLAERGVIAKPLSLAGRFHSSVHEGAVESAKTLSMSNAGLRFPTNCQPLVPLRANSNAGLVTEGSLHEIALKSILTEQSNWNLTITSSIASLEGKDSRHVLMVGLIDGISRSMLKESNLQATYLRGSNASISGNSLTDDATVNAETAQPSLSESSDYTYPDDAVAIIGMGCRFAGSSSNPERQCLESFRKRDFPPKDFDAVQTPVLVFLEISYVMQMRLTTASSKSLPAKPHPWIHNRG
jgi:hypothetical protein